MTYLLAGVIMALLATSALSLRRRSLRSMMPLFYALLICVFISFQLSLHDSRYLLPCIPFLTVYMGVVGRLYKGRHITSILTPFVVAAAILAEVGLGGGDSFTFHNRLFGGSDRQNRNISEHAHWGGDLLRLRAWLAKHPEFAGSRLAVVGPVDPAWYGISYEVIQVDDSGRLIGPPLKESQCLIISEMLLMGLETSVVDHGRALYFQVDALKSFAEEEPLDRISDRLYVFGGSRLSRPRPGQQ